MSSVDSGFTPKQRTELKGMFNAFGADLREEMRDMMQSIVTQSEGRMLIAIASLMSVNVMPTLDDHKARIHKLETVSS